MAKCICKENNALYSSCFELREDENGHKVYVQIKDVPPDKECPDHCVLDYRCLDCGLEVKGGIKFGGLSTMGYDGLKDWKETTKARFDKGTLLTFCIGCMIKYEQVGIYCWPSRRSTGDVDPRKLLKEHLNQK